VALTDQQKSFIEHYTDCWNASEAARQAGYSDHTAGQQGYRLLKLKEVQTAIKRKLDAEAMTANEVLHRTAVLARGDVADFWEVSKDGKPYFDFAACKKAGMLHLIKKVTFKDGNVSSVEFYSAQDGLRDLGRKHKLWTDNVEVKQTVTTRINYIEPVPPPDDGMADDDSSDET
jgi:phage terminase small subunit